jgi:SpoVK/Ycf46/Vps4 family AAA+-type ATPase
MDTKSFMAMSMMNGGDNNSSIFHMIFKTVMIASLSQIERVVEKVMNWFKNFISKKIENGVEEILKKDEVSSVRYDLSHIHEKYYVKIVYKKQEKEDYMSEDYLYLKALLHKFIKNNNSSNIRICKNISIPTDIGKEYEIKDGIYFTVNKFSLVKDNGLDYFNCVLSSETSNNAQIFSFLKTSVKEMEKDKTSDIMNEIYAFTVDDTVKLEYNPNYIPRVDDDNKKDWKKAEIASKKAEIASKKAEIASKKAEIASAPEELSFKITPFKSNRKQINIRGSVAESIFKKLNFFIGNKRWYSEKGIPYHFTCMLTGEPGMGKTSCIKATANTTNRHLFIVNCSVVKTSKQFINLFTKEEVVIKRNGSTSIVKIPIENRIYVLEEIDILGDILKDRRENEENCEKIPGSLSLDDFLNVLDGNIESPGRIIFITSNYPEKLDKALLRGGRIDILAKFVNLTPEYIIDYICFFTGENVKEVLANKILNHIEKWYITYADICQVLFSLKEGEDVYNILVEKNQEKYLDSLKYKQKSEEKHQEHEIEEKRQEVRNQSRQNGVITHESDPRAQATFDSKLILPTDEVKPHENQDGVFYTSDLYKDRSFAFIN